MGVRPEGDRWEGKVKVEGGLVSRRIGQRIVKRKTIYTVQEKG